MQNILEFSRQFNWIDILVFVVFLRLIFVSLKQGLGAESFKLFGTFCGLYLALHYYSALALYLNGRSGNKTPPGNFLELSSYIALFFLGYFIFWLLRVLVFRFVTAEANNPFFSKWGGFCLGLLRALLLASLILFALLVPRSAYFRDSVRYSLSGENVLKIAPSAYTWFWNSIGSRLNFGGKFNNSVADICSAESPQKNKKK